MGGAKFGLWPNVLRKTSGRVARRRTSQSPHPAGWRQLTNVVRTQTSRATAAGTMVAVMSAHSAL